MDAQFKSDVKDMVDYLSEFEVEHFFASCECAEIMDEGILRPLQDWEDIDRCSCKENKNHIMKKIKRVSDVLDAETISDIIDREE